jgi:hypothetical protein
MNIFNSIFGGKAKADESKGDAFLQLDDKITAPQDAVVVLLAGMLLAFSLVVLLKGDIFLQLADRITAPQGAVVALFVGMLLAISLVTLLKEKWVLLPARLFRRPPPARVSRVLTIERGPVHLREHIDRQAI